jgi:hypothetical protein
VIERSLGRAATTTLAAFGRFENRPDGRGVKP